MYKFNFMYYFYCGRSTVHNCYINSSKCNNLIPGIIVACRWGVESGQLVYSSTFGHVPTRIYMSHRPNKSFVSVTGQDYACVFLRSQGDGSL